MQDYSKLYIAAVAVIVAFGGLLAPVAEVKLGLGGVPWLVIRTLIEVNRPYLAVNRSIPQLCFAHTIRQQSHKLVPNIPAPLLSPAFIRL